MRRDAGRDNFHRSVAASNDDHPTVEFAGHLILLGILILFGLFLWGIF